MVDEFELYLSRVYCSQNGWRGFSAHKNKQDNGGCGALRLQLCFLGNTALILLSSKNQDIFAVCFPPYSVVEVGGRQPALLLRLV